MFEAKWQVHLFEIATPRDYNTEMLLRITMHLIAFLLMETFINVPT